MQPKYTKITIETESYYKLLELKATLKKKTWKELINYLYLKKDLIKERYS